MGNYTYCSGCMAVDGSVDLVKFVRVIESMQGDFNCSLRTYRIANKDGHFIPAVSFDLNGDGNLHEDELNDMLGQLAPFLEEGSALYCEDGYGKWMYELRDGKFVERIGETYYSDTLDETAQYKIERQGITIGLSDEELEDIYLQIGAGKIFIEAEDEEE